MWYVIQVKTGREKAVLRMIEHAVRDYEQARAAGTAARRSDASGAERDGAHDASRSDASSANAGGTANDTAARRAGGILDECFSPRYRITRVVDGEYVDTEEPLLPGYLIASTRRADKLEAMLGAVPELARILKSENAFTPLREDEVAWICELTQKGHRVVEMSEGFREGGRVVVTSGPLMGHEGKIVRVNRRKKVAYLQVNMLGRTVGVQVGFNLVKKRE